MKNVSLFIFIMLAILFSLSVDAQKVRYQDSTSADIIYLSDGNTLAGQILKYRPNHSLKFKLSSGQKINFSIVDIDSISQTSLPRALRQQVEFRETGWYNTTYLSFLNGTSPWYNNYILGVGVNNTFGRYLNRHLAVGVGTGVDYYYINEREIVVPLYVEAKLMANSNPAVQHFLMVSGGYSWALNNEEVNVNGIEGGWLFHPAIGINFGNFKHYHWQVDAGVRFQRATFEFPESWDERNKITHKMLYKRLAVRIGLTF